MKRSIIVAVVFVFVCIFSHNYSHAVYVIGAFTQELKKRKDASLMLLRDPQSIINIRY